jgi:hypothetical protein
MQQGRGARDWPAKRLQFAFNMFDLDKSASLDEAEVEAFLAPSDHASLLLFIWRFAWGLYESAHIIRCSQVEAFVGNFSTVAEEVVDAWIREFERIFGPGASLYASTFSRTVWRLYGGAKGLVVRYYPTAVAGAWDADLPKRELRWAGRRTSYGALRRDIVEVTASYETFSTTIQPPYSSTKG